MAPTGIVQHNVASTDGGISDGKKVLQVRSQVTFPNLFLLLTSGSESGEDVETVSNLEYSALDFQSKYYRASMSTSSKPRKIFNMTCECGLGKIGEVRNLTTNTRIVDGYVPETRAWMVYIQVLEMSRAAVSADVDLRIKSQN